MRSIVVLVVLNVSINTFWEVLKQITLPSGLFITGTFIYAILTVVLVHGVIYGRYRMLPRYDSLGVEIWKQFRKSPNKMTLEFTYILPFIVKYRTYDKTNKELRKIS